MTSLRKTEARKLNKVISRCLKNIRPPEDMTVDEWADRYRILSPEVSAEAGSWRTSRTPYLKAPMQAFTDPKVNHIVMVAASQVGKSEFELNVIGYIIDQDPGSILFVQPTLEDARKFSRMRIVPMIRDSKRLSKKVSDVKLTRKTTDTMLQKSFPGGMLTITGSNSASALASMPCRYVIGDERDRWAVSAGSEGDPWKLAEARQATFYNRKSIEVSTPTDKGDSNIETAFYQGTQEHWCHQCPECGKYSEITFDDIHFSSSCRKAGIRKIYSISGDITYVCPKCGCVVPESKMRARPAKWIASNPDAYKNGCRSFWLNAFSSPWTPWSKIVLSFLEAKDDPMRLKVVYNTLFGKLWENRGDLESEDAMLERRESYGTGAKGTPVEIPDGVLALTMGVDTQDNRFEYEVVGWGLYGESWGIRRGVIMGRPDGSKTWSRLDDVISHVYRFRDGKGLKISLTFIDSGGHFTSDVYRNCKARRNARVFAIKGKSAPSFPFTSPPNKVYSDSQVRKKKDVWLYTIGVDSGKEIIMSSLKVQQPGPKYCHFPKEQEKGYDEYFFNSLLSERLELTKTKRGNRWAWVKIPGHERNEALDCRNYALAAFRVLDPDMEQLQKRINAYRKDENDTKKTKTEKKRLKSRKSSFFDEW